MLNSISWTQFGTVIILALVAYYVVVGIKYYLPGLKRTTTSPTIPETLFAEEPTEDDTDEVINETENLIEKVKAAIQENAGIQVIKKIFREYPTIKDSPLRPTINELVVIEYEKYSAATLTETEVNAWWDER